MSLDGAASHGDAAWLAPVAANTGLPTADLAAMRAEADVRGTLGKLKFGAFRNSAHRILFRRCDCEEKYPWRLAIDFSLRALPLCGLRGSRKCLATQTPSR